MDTAFFAILAVMGFSLALALRGRSRMSRTVHGWELALLYVDGVFERALPPGRHWMFGVRTREIVTLPRHPAPETIHHIDVTSAERLSYRISAVAVFEFDDPRLAYEGGYREKLRLAVSDAVTQLAAVRSVETILSERASLAETLLAMLARPICGCLVKQAHVVAVTLPPELRRLYSEVERARLEGQAALERARGEQAALRSLANAARMLKGNPELMNLRLLQALSASGGRGATLVLGRDALSAPDAGSAPPS